MISLKFEKAQYNSFIAKKKEMSKKTSLEPVTRLKSEGGPMIP